MATVLQFPTAPQPAREPVQVRKSPELALSLALYGILTTEQRAKVRMILQRFSLCGDGEAEAMLATLESSTR